MKHIVCEFDDWSYLNNRFDLLFELREHFPNFKVSMFCIPFDANYELNLQTRIFRDKAVKVLKDNLDWIQIIPHGLTHIEKEFLNADKETTRLALKAIDEIFTKDGVKYEKGFKAPYWQWNQDVIDVLNEEGWWGAVDTRQPDMLKTNKFYRYDWLSCEPFWTDDKDVLKIHGHIDGMSNNDIEKSFLYLMKMPVDSEFHFVSEYLEEK